MKYYIRRGTREVIKSPVELNPVGTTEQDYIDKKLIEINEKQLYFYEQNLGASFWEIMNMEMTPQPQPVEIPIEEQYKMEVVRRINEVYSIDDQLAILFNKDTKPNDYADYQLFRQSTKAGVGKELNYVKKELNSVVKELDN